MEPLTPEQEQAFKDLDSMPWDEQVRRLDLLDREDPDRDVFVQAFSAWKKSKIDKQVAPEPDYVMPGGPAQGQTQGQPGPGLAEGVLSAAYPFAAPGMALGRAAVNELTGAPQARELAQNQDPNAVQDVFSPPGQHQVAPPGGVLGKVAAVAGGATPLGLGPAAVKSGVEALGGLTGSNVSGAEAGQEMRAAARENPVSYQAGGMLNPTNRIAGTTARTALGGALGGVAQEIGSQGFPDSPGEAANLGMAAMAGAGGGALAHGLGTRAGARPTIEEVKGAAETALGDESRLSRTRDLLTYLGLDPDETAQLVKDPDRLLAAQSFLSELLGQGHERGLGKLPGLGAVPSEISLPALERAGLGQAAAAGARERTYPQMISSESMRSGLEQRLGRVPGNTQSTPMSQLAGAPRGRVLEQLLGPKGEFLPQPKEPARAPNPVGFMAQPAVQPPSPPGINAMVPSVRVGQRIGDIASGAYASGQETGFKPYEPANAYAIDALNETLGDQALKEGVPYDQVARTVEQTRNAAEMSRVAAQLGQAAAGEPRADIPLLRANSGSVGLTVRPGVLAREGLRLRAHRIGTDAQTTAQALDILRAHTENVGGPIGGGIPDINPFDAAQLSRVLEQVQSMPEPDRAAYMYVVSTTMPAFTKFQRWLAEQDTNESR